MKLKLVAVVSLISILAIGCMDGPEYRKRIFDEYYVYSDDGKDYFLICKLGCDSDAEISGIHKISWSEKLIVLEVSGDPETLYYFIVAKRKTLRCCNNDFHIGPLVKQQADSFLKSYSISEESLRTEVYK